MNEQKDETLDAQLASNRAEDNIAANLPRLIEALRRTPYGEVRIGMRAGKVVTITRTESILPVE